MSDDKSTNPQDTTNNPSASQPRQQEDFIASVRRFADERISAALHSVFGIPSILQTPSSSNWIREEAERSRFENMNRREGGGDESSGSRDGDNGNNNGGSGGAGISGFGGGSGSSGQNPSSNSPSDTSNKDRDSEIVFTITLPRVPMPPEVLLPEPIFNVGLEAVNLLDRSLSGHIKQLEKLINEEMERQKETSTAKLRDDFGPFQQEFQRLFDMEARVNDGKASEQKDGLPNSETVIIKGSRVNGEEPKFTVTKNTGQQRPSILKELFGEDMYGAERIHPLFTSLFDEFLPDGRYNQREQPPPTPVGGWKAPTQPIISPTLPLYENPLGHVFKMMMAPWIQKIHENSDSDQFDVRGRVLNRVKNDVWNEKRDEDVSFEEYQKLMHEERTKMAKERFQRLTEKRKELDRLVRERGERGVKTDDGLDGIAIFRPNKMTKPGEEQQPKTELELHDYFASLGKEEKPRADRKQLIAQSISTTSTTGTDGVTRIKKVQERRYSDGTVEREEHSEENVNPSNQRFDPFMGHFRRVDSPKRRNCHGDDHPVIRAIEEHRKQTEGRPTENQTSATIVSDKEGESDGKRGGWGNWLWASGKKKD